MEEKQYKLLPKAFLWLFLGLLGTGLIAVYSYKTNLINNLVENGYFSILLIIELVVVLLFSFLFKKLPATIVGIFYFIYAFINGISLSSIFYVFELKSIFIILFASSAMFAVLGIYGYKTNADVGRWQPILMWSLIIGVIVSVINLFLKFSFLDSVLDWAILFTMSGVTIYDLKKVQELSLQDNIDQNKIHIYFAMQLYLDFINIFIRLLSILGKRKD